MAELDGCSGLDSVGTGKRTSTPMAVTVETLEVELGGATHAFPVIDLRDRRKRGNPKKKWALVELPTSFQIRAAAQVTGAGGRWRRKGFGTRW